MVSFRQQDFILTFWVYTTHFCFGQLAWIFNTTSARIKQMLGLGNFILNSLSLDRFWQMCFFLFLYAFVILKRIGKGLGKGV
jgi:hypothetical protein